MAYQLQDVQPGDLIRAELWMAIVNAIRDLDARLAKVEGEAPPDTEDVVIESVSPRTIRMGEQLTVKGRNFGWTTGATVVFLGENLVTAFVTGSNTELVFTIPDLADVPETGRPLQLAVSNATSTDTDTVNVLPRAVAPEGDVEIAYVGTTPATPAAGQPLLIEYNLVSHASTTVEVVLTPVISTGWTPVRLLAGSPAQPLAANRTSLARLETKSVFVEVTIPSSASAGTPFNVELRGTAGGAVMSPESRGFTVGTAAPQEDETIELSVSGGTSISVARSDTEFVPITCDFSETGDYDLTTTFEPGPSGWILDATAVPDPISITAISGVPRPGFETEVISLGLTAPGTIPPSQPVTLVVEVRKQGRTIARTVELELTAT